MLQGFPQLRLFLLRQQTVRGGGQDTVLQAHHQQGIQRTGHQVSGFADHHRVPGRGQGGQGSICQGRGQEPGQILHAGTVAAQEIVQLIQHIQQQLPHLPVLRRLGGHAPAEQVFLPLHQVLIRPHILQQGVDGRQGLTGVFRLAEGGAQLLHRGDEPQAQRFICFRLCPPGEGLAPLIPADAVFNGVVFQQHGFLCRQGGEAAAGTFQHILLPVVFRYRRQGADEEAAQPVAKHRVLASHVVGNVGLGQGYIQCGRTGPAKGDGHAAPWDAAIVPAAQGLGCIGSLGKGGGTGVDGNGRRIPCEGRGFVGKEVLFQPAKGRSTGACLFRQGLELTGHALLLQLLHEPAHALPLGQEQMPIWGRGCVHGHGDGHGAGKRSRHAQQLAQGGRQVVKAVDPQVHAGDHAAC